MSDTNQYLKAILLTPDISEILISLLYAYSSSKKGQLNRCDGSPLMEDENQGNIMQQLQENQGVLSIRHQMTSLLLNGFSTKNKRE
jgi:hypothetical protein